VKHAEIVIERKSPPVQAAMAFLRGALPPETLERSLELAGVLDHLQADDELVDQVRRATLNIPGVRGVEKLWLRKSGLEYFADLHLEVDPFMTVVEGHRIGHQVKDRLLAEFPVLRDVLVHLEPARETSAEPDRNH
jgi:divalent metal cation (Fe/Co/Zn/Cd) transporter